MVAPAVFLDEISGANAEHQPCIHGLLEKLAFRIYTSRNRAEYSLSSLDDWTNAVNLFRAWTDKRSLSSFSNMSSMEEFMHDKLSSAAWYIHSYVLSRDPYSHWMQGVEGYVENIMSSEGIHYDSPRIKVRAA